MSEYENPKKSYGDAKPALHLFPPVALYEASLVLSLGASKYGPWNWRETDIDAMTYVGAIMRHLTQFVEGEDLDEESRASHLAHIIANCAICLDSMKYNRFEDNRPPRHVVEKV